MNIKDLKVGDSVSYHSILGQGVTSKDHQVTLIDPMPNNSGCDIAWVTGKSGCVDIEHLELM